MYISKVYLKNIRCFDELTLNFNKKSKPILWTTLLGDNSTGKTTLLRSIAIGLCDESSAAGLLRESEEGYIRNGSKGDGVIEITLSDYQGKIKGTITTTIIKVRKQRSNKFLFEKLTQELEPEDFNHWGDIFICAYGIGRGVSGAGDITSYTPISAVYNLFNYSEGLQNPELVIRRIIEKKKNRKKYFEIIRILRIVLNLPESAKIEVEEDGIKIEGGPWKKKMPLRDLADGYKSMFQWVADLVGWAISYSSQYYKSEVIQGIVLVDAIEEHLHPRWQRTIVRTLHNELFKNIQFIVATHSPLVASSTVDFNDTSLIELELNEKNEVTGNLIQQEELKGLRADEVLRHHAFGLNTTASIGSLNDLERYAELASKKELSENERNEKKQLSRSIPQANTFGDSDFEIEVEKAVLITLKKMVKEPSHLHISEIKKQLRVIFTKQ